MATNADGPVALTRRRLDDAVHALADPLPVWDDGVCRWADAVYTRLRAALPGGKLVRGRYVPSSRLPCRGDVLDLLIQVDVTVGSWEPHGKSTIDRLHQLAGRGWRPQDCALIDGYCDALERWTASAAELLAESPRVFLREPCPSCGERFAYRRDSGGELVRTRALRVSESGCKCFGCGAFWAPERFEWQARLLGCEPLPA